MNISPGDSVPTTAQKGEIRELIQVPVALGLAAAVLTWVVWYFTAPGCDGLSARLSFCNPSALAGLINYGVFVGMLTSGSVVAGMGGLINIAMISRERRRADEAEKMLAEETRA